MRSESGDYQLLEALKKSRVKRQKQGRFFVESVACINAARAHGWRFSSFIYAADQQLSGWARDILAAVPAEQHLELAPELLEQLSDRSEASELMAVVEMAPDDLARIALGEGDGEPRGDMLIVVLDRPSSPGNLGTILRTADAMGAHGVVVTGHAADIYDPVTVRASLGALFATPAVRAPSSQAIEPWLARLRSEHGAQLVGTSARAPAHLADHDFRRPTILFLGNETAGLSAHCRSLCDTLVGIPQRGTASSLNVASAAAIALYEIARQRRESRPCPG
ncbi:MAG TPA: TrmH family RNA methyltransferase [Kofleriaceae bacterium]|nr:TrmH family RNA methyltransferase [Kofleriaceae bacterium]